MRLAASLERGSEHPLAVAVVEAASASGVALSPVEAVASRPGAGVVGELDAGRLALGNEFLMQEIGAVPSESLATAAAEARAAGETVVFVALGAEVLGLLRIADPIKPGALEALDAIRGLGLRVVMATGDHRATAAAVAGELAIDQVEAGLLPAEKAALIERLQGAGATVAMAGDGINDAPALARADVGIAMGSGTDVAIESSAVTLVGGELGGVVRAVRLSRATMRNIRQNLFFAFVYNGLGIPVAAGVFYPLFGWLLNPMIAAAAMSFSSVSVIANALRLRGARL